jgi:hypothetical protein
MVAPEPAVEPEPAARPRRLKIRRKVRSRAAAAEIDSSVDASTAVVADAAITDRRATRPPVAVQINAVHTSEFPSSSVAEKPNTSALLIPLPKVHDPSLVRMLLAFTSAGLSLALSQAPYGRFTSLVLAVPGLFFGLSSLSIARKRLLPGLAAGLNGAIIVVVMMLPGWLGLPSWGLPAAHDDSESVRAVRHNSGGASSPAEWVDASKESWRQGDVLVSVRSLKLDTVLLTGPQEKKMRTKEPYLQISLRIGNEGFTRKVEFAGWGQPDSADAPRLTDSAGDTLPAKSFDAGWEPPGKPISASIFPGKWTEHLLIFVAPKATSGDLHLELPGNAFGSKEPVRLLITRAWLDSRTPKKQSAIPR